MVVATSALFDRFSYGSPSACWLRADNYFVFSFVGPALAVVLVRRECFIYALCWILQLIKLDGFGPTGQIYWPVARGPWPVARRPVGPKDREYVKSITYKALARVDATAKYSHSGEMLSCGL